MQEDKRELRFLRFIAIVIITFMAIQMGWFVRTLADQGNVVAFENSTEYGFR